MSTTTATAPRELDLRDARPDEMEPLDAELLDFYQTLILTTLNREGMQDDWVRVLRSRIPANVLTHIDDRLTVFCRLIANDPGDIVLWAWTLARMAETEPVTVIRFQMQFTPDRFPGQAARRRIWKALKRKALGLPDEIANALFGLNAQQQFQHKLAGLHESDNHLDHPHTWARFAAMPALGAHRDIYKFTA